MGFQKIRPAFADVEKVKTSLFRLNMAKTQVVHGFCDAPCNSGSLGLAIVFFGNTHRQLLSWRGLRPMRCCTETLAIPQAQPTYTTIPRMPTPALCRTSAPMRQARPSKALIGTQHGLAWFAPCLCDHAAFIYASPTPDIASAIGHCRHCYHPFVSRAPLGRDRSRGSSRAAARSGFGRVAMGLEPRTPLDQRQSE